MSTTAHLIGFLLPDGNKIGWGIFSEFPLSTTSVRNKMLLAEDSSGHFRQVRLCSISDKPFAEAKELLLRAVKEHPQFAFLNDIPQYLPSETHVKSYLFGYKNHAILQPSTNQPSVSDSDFWLNLGISDGSQGHQSLFT